MKMLIVEDDLPLAIVLQQAFVREQNTVRRAASFAITMLDASEYELVLLDLSLARLDGIEVLRHLQQGRRATRVLVFSGRSPIEDRVRTLDDGADVFSVKPFSLMELSARE